MFYGKIRYNSLIQNCLAVGYRVHFVRFCTTYCCDFMAVRGEAQPLSLLTDCFFILRFLGLILCNRLIGNRRET